MKYQFFIMLILAFYACGPENLVEIKDGNGMVVETYFVDEASKKHGEYKKFDDQGNLIELAHYSNGKLNGKRTLYYENGQIEIEEEYAKDVMAGPYKVYHKNGALDIEASYIKGQMQGVLKKYSDQNQLIEEVTFVDGEENGVFKEYHENGKVKWEGTYLNGDNEFGLLKEYDATGQLIKKMMCDSLAVCRSIWTIKDGDIPLKK